MTRTLSRFLHCTKISFPPVWYSFTPEYMYFGGVKEEKENRLFFIGPVLINNCSRKQAESILQRIGRKGSNLSSLLRSFSDYANCNASSLIAHLNPKQIREKLYPPISVSARLKKRNVFWNVRVLAMLQSVNCSVSHPRAISTVSSKKSQV